MSECPYDKAANTADCGNPYQHWEKKNLIEALLGCHADIDFLQQTLRETAAMVSNLRNAVVSAKTNRVTYMGGQYHTIEIDEKEWQHILAVADEILSARRQ